MKPLAIFANGAPCSLTLVNEILALNPFCVVLDGAITHIKTYSFQPHLWLGDFDHQLQKTFWTTLFPAMEVLHTPDQEYTDLEKALYWAVEHQFTDVYILWATGKRTDHHINNIVNIARFKQQLNIVLLDDYSVITPLPYRFKKHYPQGTPISLVPLGTVTGITTQNLKYPLNNSFLQLGYRNGTSNEVIETGWVSITYQEGDLLLMECKDETF